MSHLETVAVHIVDLEALKSTCKRMGVEFREGQKTFTSYQGQMPCEHAIHVEGVLYEVGVVPETGEVKAKKSWKLQADFYGPGRELQKRFCKLTETGAYSQQMTTLVDAYSIELLKRQAHAKGYRTVERVLPNGKVQLRAYGMN